MLKFEIFFPKLKVERDRTFELGMVNTRRVCSSSRVGDRGKFDHKTNGSSVYHQAQYQNEVLWVLFVLSSHLKPW